MGIPKTELVTIEQKTSGVRSGSQRMRESLESQLVGTQVEEALAGDRQAALIQHLELATNALEALTQHVRSMRVSHLAAHRVLNLAHQLVVPYSTCVNYSSSLPVDLITRLQQAEIQKENRLLLLRDVVENCSKNIAVSKQLQALVDDHRVKKEDFSMAARNFKDLLENSKLTVSQMEKLHRQYQTILDDYQQSRRILETELPKIVRMRLGALRHGFQMIAEFYEDIEYCKQTADLFKILGEKLCQDEPAVEHILYDHPQAQEICQKCKVNRVDKK